VRFSSAWLAASVGAALAATLPAYAAEPDGCSAPTGNREADVAKARQLFDQALGLEPAQPEAALRVLFCAERLTANAAVALRIGTIAERLGRYGAAAAAFERYLERAGERAPDAAQIRARIRSLRDRARGDLEEPVPTEPPASTEPAPEGSASWVGGWVLVSSGLGFGIVGAALLGAAGADASAVHHTDPGTVAWDSDEARGRFEKAELEQALGVVGVVVGATAATLGIVLLATADESVEVTGALGPGVPGGSIRVAF
jgi:hypothetical protein